MNGLQALDLLRRETGRRTQSQLAADIGVSEATVSRWLSAKAPPKRGLSVLVDWAERQDVPADPLSEPQAFDAAVAAIVATGENRARLGVVQGYAQFVLDQLLDIAKRQQLVVDSLRPYAEAEGRVLAANVPPEKIPELLDSIRRYGAQTNAPGSDRATGTG